MTFKHKLSKRLAMIYDPLRRILFDPFVILLVLLIMIAARGSDEPFSAPRRRSVRVVIQRMVTVATMVGGPLGGVYILLALWVLRGCGHVATLLAGGPVLWEPVRVPGRHEQRVRYRRLGGYVATREPRGALPSAAHRRRVDTLPALDMLEVYVGHRGWRFYVPIPT